MRAASLLSAIGRCRRLVATAAENRPIAVGAGCHSVPFRADRAEPGSRPPVGDRVLIGLLISAVVVPIFLLAIVPLLVLAVCVDLLRPHVPWLNRAVSGAIDGNSK
jgi:hypothetical protein